MIWVSSDWLGMPLVFAILLVGGLLLVLGTLLRGIGPAARAPGSVCPDPECGHINPPNARYCARCGQRLPEE